MILKKSVRSWKHICNLIKDTLLLNEYTGEILTVNDAIHSIKYVGNDCDEFIESGEFKNRLEIYNVLSREHKYFLGSIKT